MGSKAPKVKTPKKIPIGQSIKEYTTGYGEALPDVLALEKQYRPEFGKLNLADIGQYQQGLQGLKADEFAGMAAQTGQVRDLIGGISPEAKRMMELQNMQAEDAYARSQRLNPQEQRSAEQTARESFGAAGRLGGNYGVASEILNRENYLSGKRQEASGLIGQAYNTSQNFYSPAYSMLGGSLGGAMGLLGQSTPGLINPDTGVNIAAAHQQNVIAAQSANAQAAASKSSGMFGGIGSALGGLAGGAGMSFSDKRLKKDIKKVGITDGGLDVYTYKYKAGGPTQMGVMAQDVEIDNPDAVTEIDGFKAVNYSKIK